MFQRLLRPSQAKSFFLFGARGTGKTTYLESQFGRSPWGASVDDRQIWRIDLLDLDQEDFYLRRPMALESELEARARAGKKTDWIIIDEIQRAPTLLNVVHRLIESKKQKFVLTGSSARKLKRGASNLLAGRAHVHFVYPLTHHELASRFDLAEVLRWGSLPGVLNLNQELDRKRTLKSYALTYLKEEIQAEQLLRKVDPFRNFLEVAAQLNGEKINSLKLARDLGVDHKTVRTYYTILEETWVGSLLPAFSHSVRKQQKLHPKFYFFDEGVKRSLDGTLDSVPAPGNRAYGEAFESFVINEALRLNSYFEKDFRMSYLETSGGGEIDLILQKGKRVWAIEIKSSFSKDVLEIAKLERLARDIPGIVAIYYLSQDPRPEKLGAVRCVPWQTGLTEIFGSSD